MANEFIIKNGFRSQGNSEITGSLSISGGITGSLQGTASYAAAAVVFPYTGSALITGSLIVTGSLTVYDLTNNNRVLSTSARTMWGANTSESIDWDRKRLYSTDGQPSVFWNTRIAYDSTGRTSIDWASRQLYDSNSTPILSVDWRTRSLWDGSGALVLDWQSRQFTGTASYATYAATAAPGGSTTEIQFNDGGTLTGTSNLTYNKDQRSLQLGEGATTSGLYSIAHGKNASTYAKNSYSHGSNTNTGIGTAYQAELVGGGTSGAYKLAAEYGDISAYFNQNDTLYFDDTRYSNVFGYIQCVISSSTFNGTQTIIQLVDTNITTSLADVAVNTVSNNIGNQRLGGLDSHAEGAYATTFGQQSHVEGSGTTAFGLASHAEGNSTSALGDYSHTEGDTTQANGESSHAEGSSTIAYGDQAHAEGLGSIAGAWGYASNTKIDSGIVILPPEYGDVTPQFNAGEFILIDDADGSIEIDGVQPFNGVPTVYKLEIASSTFSPSYRTEITLVNTTVGHGGTYFIGHYSDTTPLYARTSIGIGSHAAGESTQTWGYGSSTTGKGTQALGWHQSVIGQYNQTISQPSAFIVGDGVDDTTRHNLLVAASGNVTISGSLLMSGSISNFIKGEATIDFGSTPGSNYATTTISTPFVTNNSNIHIYIMSTASADHNAMEHQIFSLYGTVMPDNIIDNTSFDIVALSQLRLDGTFKVRYTINNN